jgi:hypothetical protein
VLLGNPTVLNGRPIIKMCVIVTLSLFNFIDFLYPVLFSTTDQRLNGAGCGTADADLQLSSHPRIETHGVSGILVLFFRLTTVQPPRRLRLTLDWAEEE